MLDGLFQEHELEELLEDPRELAEFSVQCPHVSNRIEASKISSVSCLEREKNAKRKPYLDLQTLLHPSW